MGALILGIESCTVYTSDNVHINNIFLYVILRNYIKKKGWSVGDGSTSLVAVDIYWIKKQR